MWRRTLLATCAMVLVFCTGLEAQDRECRPRPVSGSGTSSPFWIELDDVRVSGTFRDELSAMVTAADSLWERVLAGVDPDSLPSVRIVGEWRVEFRSRSGACRPSTTVDPPPEEEEPPVDEPPEEEPPVDEGFAVPPELAFVTFDTAACNTGRGQVEVTFAASENDSIAVLTPRSDGSVRVARAPEWVARWCQGIPPAEGCVITATAHRGGDAEPRTFDWCAIVEGGTGELPTLVLGSLETLPADFELTTDAAADTTGRADQYQLHLVGYFADVDTLPMIAGVAYTCAADGRGGGTWVRAVKASSSDPFTSKPDRACLLLGTDSNVSCDPTGWPQLPFAADAESCDG